jgi:hypothetical protein
MIQTSVVFPTNQEYDLTDVVKQVLDMRTKAFEERRYGPFMVIYGPEWTEHLSKSFVHPKHPDIVPELTVKGRILKIEGIVEMLLCQQMEKFDLALVEVIVKAGEGYGDGSFLGIKEEQP